MTSVEKSADGRRSIKLSINPKSVNKGLNASALTSGMVCVHSLSSLLRCFLQCVSGTPHFVLVCDQNRTGSCPHQGNRSGGRGQYWILVMFLQAVAHETYSSDLVIYLFWWGEWGRNANYAILNSLCVSLLFMQRVVFNSLSHGGAWLFNFCVSSFMIAGLCLQLEHRLYLSILFLFLFLSYLSINSIRT